MRSYALVVGFILAFCLSAPAAAREITWEVKDRFRLFDQAEPASRARIAALLDELDARRAAGGSLSESYSSLLANLSGSAAASLRSSHWSRATRTYSRDYLYPRSYKVGAQLKGAAANARCRWKVDGAQQVEAACGQKVELAIPSRRLDGGGWGAQAKLAASVDDGEEHVREIVLRDRLVAAIGDSFISGEGNPDVPSNLRALKPSVRFSKPHWPGSLDARKDRIRVAEWWDEPCHRSLLSWPVLAGLWQAAGNRQEAVTLVHLGCSGAKTTEGVTSPQTELAGCPKGMDEPRTCPPGSKEQASQLQQLSALLAANADKRSVDRLYMSLGGIDIGFSGLIAYALLPPDGYVLGPVIPTLIPLVSDQEIVCPYRTEVTKRSRLCAGTTSAGERLDALPSRYDMVSGALRKLGVAPAAVVQATYPDVLSAENGTLCRHAPVATDLKALDGNKLYEAIDYIGKEPLLIGAHGFEAIQSLIPALARPFGKWNFQFDYSSQAACNPARPNISDPEICKLNWVRVNLNRQVTAAAAKHGWKSVTAHEKLFEGHGWCVADDAHPLALPLAQRTGRGWAWQPASGIASFDPYAEKNRRWVRTANDSLMTQFGGKERVIQGTIHPTFRAHVAYAEAAAAVQ